MDWNIPKLKWEDIDPEKLESMLAGMSQEQMSQFIKEAYISAKKTLPEGPEKVLILKIGRLCIQADELRYEYENTQDDDQRKEIADKLEKNVTEAISLFMKIVVLRGAKQVEQEVIEIKESEKYEDPWVDSWEPPKPKVKPSIREEKEQKEEYDPWKVEDESSDIRG